MPLIDTLRQLRATERAELDDLAAISDRDLTEAESARFDELVKTIKKRDARIADLEQREDKSAAEDRSEPTQEERSAAAAASRAATGQGGGVESATTSAAVIGSEPRTYTRDSARQGVSWFADAFRSHFFNDRGANERLERHAREMRVEHEQRDVGTPAFGALIPPQYLVDQFAPLARAGRPVANAVMGLPLPAEGMVMNIPRLTTGTSTAVQATENAAVSETDLDETTLTFNVVTIAGQQDVSRQSLERASGNDEIIFADLAASYAVTLDTQVINGSGSSGQHLGLLNTSGIEAVTYTDATPTLSELYPKLADAVQRINSLRFLPASVVFMHPRRWGWMTAQLDSSGRPLVTEGAPQNPVGLGSAAEYGQVVGTIPGLGLPVITDANIPTNLGAGTNEDIIIVARAADLMLWEGSATPRQLRFEETLGGNLTVKLVSYDYSAFTAGRYPKAVATVGGTGLVPPTF